MQGTGLRVKNITCKRKFKKVKDGFFELLQKHRNQLWRRTKEKNAAAIRFKLRKKERVEPVTNHERNIEDIQIQEDCVQALFPEDHLPEIFVKLGQRGYPRNF